MTWREQIAVKTYRQLDESTVELSDAEILQAYQKELQPYIDVMKEQSDKCAERWLVPMTTRFYQ